MTRPEFEGKPSEVTTEDRPQCTLVQVTRGTVTSWMHLGARECSLYRPACGEFGAFCPLETPEGRWHDDY